MDVTLEVLNTRSNIRKVRVMRTAILGRGRDCGLRFASHRVSRRHCELLVSDESVRIRDLGSSNGTFVNGKQLEAGLVFELDPDDEVRLGSVRMRVSFVAPIQNVVESPSERSPEDSTSSAIGLPAVGSAIEEEPTIEDSEQDASIISGPIDLSDAESFTETHSDEPQLDGEAAAMGDVDEDEPFDEEDPSFLEPDEEPPKEAPAKKKQSFEVGNEPASIDDSAILDFLGNLE